MSHELWTSVDRYITDVIVHPDAALQAALVSSDAGGLPPISVSPPQGRLLELLALLRSARRILEIGTLGGYSTICLARGLAEGGSLISLEVNPHHAEVARTNIARAGLAAVVDVRVGRALDTLPQIAAAGDGPFDLIFIDADKPNNAAYFEWAMKLSRPGTLIIVDNVVRKGAVIDEGSTDPNVQGTRELNRILGAESRVRATEIQTVGGKGYDGLAFVLVAGGERT
jgi:predicted O-methyltransferase YrrM